MSHWPNHRRARVGSETGVVRARRSSRGFTLVELMTVVSIIAILAVLASYGVVKYIAAAKSAEATNAIGAINRAAVAAYTRERGPNSIVVGGKASVTAHVICGSSAAVPATDASIQKRKYTANPAVGQDYHIGSRSQGWPCLEYEMTGPQYYRYKYTAGSTPALATNVTPAAGGSWLAEARGDLDGDGAFSGFITGGKIVNNEPITFTAIAEVDPEE